MGDQKIYDYQLNEYLDSFQAQGRKDLKSSKVKQELLQKYVIDQILWQKSKRLGLEKEPDFVKKLENITKQLLVEKLLKDEVEKKIKVDEVDLKNYYKANKEKFTRKETRTVTKLEFKGKEQSKKLQLFLKKMKEPQKDTASLLKEVEKKFPSVTLEKEIILTKDRSSPNLNLSPSEKNGVFKKDKGDWSGPFLKSGVYTIVMVTGKTLPQEYIVDIKDIVKQSYKMEKGEVYTRSLFKSLLNENVKLFVESEMKTKHV